MEQTKDLFFFLLLAGQEIPSKTLLTMLAELSDLSGLSNENDFKTADISFTRIFVEKASKSIERDYDEFIEYYKSCLMKNENYELITYLEL